MAQGKARPAELKAAVLAALMTGQSVDAVADQYSVPRGTVLDWKRQAKLATEVVRTEKDGGSDIVALIDRYLVRNLETVTAQAEFFSDPGWLAKANAADAAVLHGVLVDKAVRILQAAEAANAPDPEGDTESPE